MELNASRTAARRGSNGEAVLLPDQDRSLWDDAQIQRGMSRSNTRKDSVAALDTMLCRQRLLHVTCELAQPKRLTGNGSFFSTTL
jgi:hypothetical protein